MKTKTKNSSDGKLLALISGISGKVLNLTSTVENIQGKTLEYIATLLYAVAHLLMAIVHEPWFDESVAWQIARCASVPDILLEIPHYEGHPPLWHLILLPFAKLGAPYELSMTIVSLIFAGAAIGLIIWKSPFPRIIRLLLPFTYFFFYQYGVISRPYCVMMFAFVLLAMTYQSRKEQPWKYTLCLMLLCLTSAYGIVMAGGLAIAWVWEIWNRRKIKDLITSCLKDKRIYCLAGLLAFALVLIALIMPKEDTYALNPVEEGEIRNGFVIRLFYMLTSSISDVLITDVYSDYSFLKTTYLSYTGLICSFFIGALILFTIACYGKKKKTALLFFIPYTLFGVFSSIVYVCLHHIGIVLLLFVFWFWASLQEPDSDTPAAPFIQNNRELITDLLVFAATAIMLMSLTWNITACIQDIYKDYAVGRNISKFIAENNLDDYKIMAEWDVLYDSDTSEIAAMDTQHCVYTDSLSPYFEHNIFYNFMDGEDSLNYMSHKLATEEQNARNLAKWKEMGYPDVLFQSPDLNVLWDSEELNYLDYTLVYYETHERIWKINSQTSVVSLRVRKDLATELGLEEVEWYNAFEQ